MHSWKLIVPLLFGLSGAGYALAQAPAGAPAGTNGLCNDGSYSSAAHKQGACHGRGGCRGADPRCRAGRSSGRGGPRSAGRSAQGEHQRRHSVAGGKAGRRHRARLAQHQQQCLPLLR
jgi:hypothetical protein